jgi:hypothetical protein
MQASRSNGSRRSDLARWLLTFAAFTLLWLAAAPAWAQTRVVVTDLTGDKKGAARAAVIDAVGQKGDALSAKEADAAIKKAKAKKLTKKTAAKLARTAKADFVISGDVKKKGKALTVNLTVRDAKGAVVGDVSVTAKRGKFNDAFKDQLAGELGPLLSAGGAAAPADDEPAEDDDQPAEDDQPADDKPADDKPAEDDKPVAEAEPTVEDEVELGNQDPEHYRYAALELALTVPVIGRNLSFSERAGLTPDQRPTRYKGATVPAAGVEIEAYPLALGQHGRARRAWWRQFGLAAGYERVLALKSKSGTEEFTTTMQRFDVGLRWRWNPGQKATLPTIALALTYGQQSFEIDDGTTLGLPNTKVTYLGVGLRARVPLGLAFAVLVAGDYLLVQDAGDINAMDAYGPGSASGLEIEGGLEYRIMPRLPVRAGVRFVQTTYEFDGTGDLSNNLDNDPTTVDVSAAKERVLGGFVSIAYLF